MERTERLRPKNRPSDTGGWLRTPGLATQRESFLTATERGALKQRGWQQCEKQRGLATQRESGLTATERGTLGPALICSQKGREPKDPSVRRGVDPRSPGVAAPLSAAGCRGSCWRVVDGRRGKIDLHIFYVLTLFVYDFTASWLKAFSRVVCPLQGRLAPQGYMLRDMCRGSSLHGSCVLASSLLFTSSLASWLGMLGWHVSRLRLDLRSTTASRTQLR